MKSTTRSASLTSGDRSFLLSASSNGIFINLFSINGWLLQIFAVQILTFHKSTIDSLVLAYPAVMLFELSALALSAYFNPIRLLFASFVLRSILVVAMLIPAYLGALPQLVLISYYGAFFFHIAGFHVCWPLFVKFRISRDRRGQMLGLARAYTNLLSLVALLLIFLAGSLAQNLAAMVAVSITVLASGLALSGIYLQTNRSHIVSSRSHSIDNTGPLSVLNNFGASLYGLRADRHFWRIATETFSIGIASLPLPLLFLPQAAHISASHIILAFMVGTALSILVFPAFGRLMDHSESKAYSAVFLSGIASLLLVAAVLLFRNMLSSNGVLAGAFLGIVSNFVSVRLGALFSYKRALEVTEPRAAAASAVITAWIFDLAVWLVVAALQILSRFGPTDTVDQNYVLICFVSATASIVCFFLSRQQQAPQHA
jgi:hypothetical protein